MNSENLRITHYTSDQKKNWDDFVQNSKNGNFIFLRDYMEYHQDRFHDHSLMIYEKDQLVALLPGHTATQNYFSHNGLSYGGFLTDSHMKTPLMLDIFKETTRYLQDLNYKKWFYKSIPHIHHILPAEEDLYALFIHEAQLWRRDVMPVVFPDIEPKIQERRSRGIKKALKAGIVIKETNNLAVYWNILSEVLWKQHQVKPVHSLKEIMYLQAIFPKHIKLYAAYSDEETMIAGVLCYQSAKVWRSQYIASNAIGRKHSALDLIFFDLLKRANEQKVCFDFGPCNENNGKILNTGLIEQKEGFGARAITHDFYELIL